MEPEPEIYSSYLNEVFKPGQLLTTVSKTIAMLEGIRKEYPFEAIAFTGISGASVAFPVSMMMGVPLICVRRDGDQSHHSAWGGVLEGAIKVKSFVILDDFIGGGATITRILERIHAQRGSGQCVAIALWAYGTRYNFSAQDYPDGIPVFDNLTYPGSIPFRPQED